MAAAAGIAVGGTWLSPSTVISDTSESAFAPAVAMGPSGVGQVVWQQPSSPVAMVRAHPLGSGPSSGPATLSGTGDIDQAEVTVDPAGVATATWTFAAGFQAAQTIQASRFVNGAWGPVVDLGTSAADTSQFPRDPLPSVAADGAGGVTAVWRRHDGTNWQAMGARFRDGAWGAATPLSGWAANVGSPSVAAGRAGEALAVWQELVGTDMHIRAARVDASGWSAPTTLSTDGAGPHVAGAANGVGVAVWRSMSTDVVHAARFDGRSWGAASALSSATAPAAEALVAVDNSGTATVAWVGRENNQGTLWAVRDDGGSWGTPVRVATGTAQYYAPPIAAARGKAVVLFRPESGTPSGALWAAQFTGTTWAAPVQIAGDAFAEKVAADAAGAVVAAWQTDEGNNVIRTMRMANSPAEPRDARATAGAQAADVSWSAPVADGGSAVTSYTATALPGGATCSATSVAGCRVTGLTAGTAYRFTVTATNAQGTSPASDPTAAVTPTAAPAPARLRALRATYRLRGRALTTRGRLPAGATGVIQIARRTSARATSTMDARETAAKVIRGRCRLAPRRPKSRSLRAFTCTMRFRSRGRWEVTTTARKRTTPVARSVRVVTVRR